MEAASTLYLLLDSRGDFGTVTPPKFSSGHKVEVVA